MCSLDKTLLKAIRICLYFIWTEVFNIVQETVTKTIPKKKKYKKAKWLSKEALETAEKRKEVKGRERGNVILS